MRWKNLEGQRNIEDRRSRPGRQAGKARGIGTLGVVATLITLFLGGGENVGLGPILDHQDVQEAIDAASTVGDDRIQEKTTGRINPEDWTHGSSEQCAEHFMIGFRTGDANQCDTFS
jgi:predicted metalloprotease